MYLAPRYLDIIDICTMKYRTNKENLALNRCGEPNEIEMNNDATINTMPTTAMEWKR